MGKIFVITGKSGAGKDTIINELLKHESLNLVPWVPSTTRPMRPGEKEGREYHFKTNEEFQQDLQNGRVVEYRTYNHFKLNGQELPVSYYECFDLDPNKNYIIAVPPDVLPKFVEYIKNKPDFEVISLYLMLDPVTRLQRMYERELRNGSSQFQEVCRRFLADENDYGNDEDALINYQIDYPICVKTIQETVENIIFRMVRVNAVDKALLDDPFVR